MSVSKIEGTFGFIAPEQQEFKIDFKTDVYAIGCLIS